MKNHKQIILRIIPTILGIVVTVFCFGQAPKTTKYIIVDQFGYRNASKKMAVIRNPQTGFDSAETFNPGSSYSVVKVADSTQVYTAAPVSWKNGITDGSSGDKAWWFDFSEIQEPGSYFVLDVDSNLCSFEFEIKENIYEEILIQAVRTFFYQRFGFAKETPFACDEWVDGASHLQDKKARDFLNRTASTEKDVSGGWYDAGDFNKYTSWTSNYIVEFMMAFLENPGVWGDDYNIPESGNNIPDILDEAKWGLDHLIRLQQADGSLLSVVGAAHASPPSSATGPSYYGRPNTSGTLNALGAFALASKVYRSVGMKQYSDSLKKCAIRAWDWAEENPNVLFYNNSGNTQGLAAGQQETDDYGRFIAKMEAAAFLWEITADPKYKSFFESNYREVHIMQWNFAYPFESQNQEMLLYYTRLPGISSSVKNAILSKYKSAMDKSENFTGFIGNKDPYLAHIKDYTWGSNNTKSRKGLMFTSYIHYDINSAKNQTASEAAENYIHYLHGVNPFNLVYLSNMCDFGAENTVNEFYHTWFKNGSAKWDRVGESTYGPAPGFVTGGPNPGYNWDGCCPNGCGSFSNNQKCYATDISSILNQPAQKSYLDFNDSWPLNSWSVTENSCGYQLSYIRLLFHFVPKKYDCAGILNGTASYDACGVCSGGTTGIEQELNSDSCIPTGINDIEINKPRIFPNPTDNVLNIHFKNQNNFEIKILNSQGQKLLEKRGIGNVEITTSQYTPGLYFVVINDDKNTWKEIFIKL